MNTLPAVARKPISHPYSNRITSKLAMEDVKVHYQKTINGFVRRMIID